MTFRPEYIPKQQPTAGIVPFGSAEEAWFWLVAAQEARTDGARVVAGQGKLLRPCEPVDILRVVDRLYRQRRLMRDHLLVLRYYGKRRLPPEPRRLREARAYTIWTEALERIEAVLIAKGIVGKVQVPSNQEYWRDKDPSFVAKVTEGFKKVYSQ